MNKLDNRQSLILAHEVLHGGNLDFPWDQITATVESEDAPDRYFLIADLGLSMFVTEANSELRNNPNYQYHSTYLVLGQVWRYYEVKK